MNYLERLKVPKLGQIGIVVKDIDETIRYYEETFGIGPWAVFYGEPETCVDRGREITFKGKMAMARAGTVQLELIQILEGEGIHSDFLKENGEGVHHIGFFVRDVEERVEAAKEAGIEILQRGLLKQLGISIDYAYLDTTVIGGVIIEFIEARFLGIPFPLKSPLTRYGAKLADRIH